MCALLNLILLSDQLHPKCFNWCYLKWIKNMGNCKHTKWISERNEKPENVFPNRSYKNEFQSKITTQYVVTASY